MKKQRWRAKDYVVIPRSILTQKISPSALRLWIALASFCYDDDKCYPSNRAVLERFPPGTALNTVKAAKRELEEAGLISRQRRFKDGRETSSIYFLLAPQGTQLIKSEGNETITHVGNQMITYEGNRKVTPLREQQGNKTNDGLILKTVDGFVFDKELGQWVEPEKE